MINGAEIAQGLKDRLLSYMTSALPVGNHESQRLLGQRFFEAWQKDLFKGPYFETIPPYERRESIAERFRSKALGPDDTLFVERFRPKFSWADIDHRFPFARPLRDRTWAPGSREADLESSTTTQRALWTRRLFKHQWDAFDRAVYKGQNIVVATATGSGKTECFQLPILYRLLTEPASIRAQRGVRALLVYPLNALVEDQSTRLRRLLFWLNLQFHEAHGRSERNHRITFGRYTGDTPVHARDFTRREPAESLSGLGELVYREDMQASPPDILITNFTMLEYILLREDDRQLFGKPELLSFIVLDEVHTYSGTQGMEVAMLLKRLRGFLEARARRPLSVQCIGTSATLGGADPQKDGAAFATRLFGARLDPDNVVLGSQLCSAPVKWDPPRWKNFLALLGEGEKASPLASLLNGEDPEPDDHLWRKLAEALHVPDSVVQGPAPTSERLGILLDKSGIADQIRSVIERQAEACIDLDSLAELISGHAREPRVTAGRILGLLASATHNREPVLALRTHLFVNEARSAQLCLYPKCQPAPGGTDTWWRQLYVAHHTSCDICGSLVYAVLLCRRCGFAYLEGWCSKGVLWSEQDSAEKPEKYERWLFRPTNSDLPAAAKGVGEARTFCLCCGRCFVGRDRETFATSQESHHCPTDGLLDVWAWRPVDLEGGKLKSCLFCEQHWIPGEEVITAPAPSTYAVSALLLEELKRQFSASGAASKTVSFSDSRQQAARLALRLQRTNRDFTFRQMVYQILSQQAVSAEDLLEQLFDFSRDYPKLRLVMATDPARLPDNAQLREQLATLLYREAVTAYLTLEAQGLVRIQYDRALLDAAREIDAPSKILAHLSGEEKEHWLIFLLDWGMRFVRYGLGSHRWGGPALDHEKLKEWNIYPKSAAIFGSQDQRIFGFLIRKRNSRNAAFNFASRVLQRGLDGAGELELEEFHAATRPFWDMILGSPHLWARDPLTATRPVLNSGGADPERCLLQLNFSSLLWRRARPDEPLFRCDRCGRLAFYSLKGVCPITDCSGTLEQTSHRKIDESLFSPVRHYRKLVGSAAITPLRVEEHTAQISPDKRAEIEREFRSTGEDSVDVICGSTTFELGIDLGSIQSVFMSNLPPRAANYRQRAGRAGRRPGAQPFVLNYVRQRPHDQYFWGAPQSFIAGPLPVPRLSISSKEVVLRHISAILVARLLELYRKERPGQMQLTGPPSAAFVEFALSTFTDIRIEKELESPQMLSNRLDHILKGIQMPLDKSACWEGLKSRLKALQETYLDLHADEGCLDVLSDHGILPSYAFPIYVDELRLWECPPREPPRSDLKLQRDRSVALREYSPGRTFVAGKYLILSQGLWRRYLPKDFAFCPKCSAVDFRPDAGTACPRCQTATQRKKAVIPRGGFYGRVIHSASESIEQEPPEVTDVYFDPAEDPPPETRPVGQALTIALLDARQMRSSRMRMFSPRPGHDGMLMAQCSLSDAASPHSPAAICLQRVTDSQAEKLHLMHEFTTDILQIRFADNAIGRLILDSPPLQDEIRADPGRREWLYDSVWLTLATALSLSGARILDIDPAEIAPVVRRVHHRGTLGDREITLYDTTAGGAGYARQLGERIAELLPAASRRLGKCVNECQDSCVACLRTYHNQPIHSRLHRKRASDGFSRFLEANFG